MEREFIAHHIKEDSGLEHLIASMQPKVLRRLLDALDGAKEDSRSTRSTWQCLQEYPTLARLDYEELGNLSDPGQRDCSQAWNILE